MSSTGVGRSSVSPYTSCTPESDFASPLEHDEMTIRELQSHRNLSFAFKRSNLEDARVTEAPSAGVR